MSRSNNTYGDAPKALRVDVLGLDSEIAYWTFTGRDELRVVVGSAPDCDWLVRGVGIAPHHLELVWFEDNLWVRALAHPDGRPAPAGDWQQVEDGVRFDLGAMRVQVRSAQSEPVQQKAAWVDADHCATVITSASPGSSGHGDTLSALPAVAPAFEELEPEPAPRRRSQGMMESHTAIVQPSQLRQWAAAVDSQPGQMVPVEAPREPAPAQAARVHAFDGNAAADELGDSNVFAMPPPIEQGPPPVVQPPLWKTMWWAIPGRTVLILSAVAALVCFVWFPKLLSAERQADGIQVRTRSAAAPSDTVETRPTLVLEGVAHADEPELAKDERIAAGYLVAGNYRQALVAYRALVEAAQEAPAYAAMVELLERKIAAADGCEGGGAKGEACAGRR